MPLKPCALVLAATLRAGCAGTCRATDDRLAALRRDMTYEQTVQVMGCAGRLTTADAPSSGGFATVEWDGPRSYLFTGTQADFLDGKLISYTVGQRGGL